MKSLLYVATVLVLLPFVFLAEKVVAQFYGLSGGVALQENVAQSLHVAMYAAAAGFVFMFVGIIASLAGTVRLVAAIPRANDCTNIKGQVSDLVFGQSLIVIGIVMWVVFWQFSS